MEMGHQGLIKEDSSISVMLYTYKPYNEEYMVKNELLNGMTWQGFKDSLVKEELEVSPNVVELLRNGTGVQKLDVLWYQIPSFIDKEAIPMPVEQIIIFAILAILIFLLAFGLIRKTAEDEIVEIEPELSVEELLVSSEIEEKAIDAGLAAFNENQQSEARRQVEKFATERPEDTAKLLRNWLNEGWE